MTTANAVTGTQGQILFAGIDTHSPSVQVEIDYHDQFLLKVKKKEDWKSTMLVNLINSNVSGFNKIGRTLQLSGMDLYTHCKYTRTGNTYYLKLQGNIFRIYGNNVSLIKGKRR